MTIELTQKAPTLVHVEATPPTTLEQLDARLQLNIGMIAVIDTHIQELQKNADVHAAQIYSRNRQKLAYEIEQRTLQAQIEML